MVFSSWRVEGGTGTGTPNPHNLPAPVRKTIQSIKEIVKNHSDSDIYATLKESNMDPNETAQKLLNQDPFHEVKRKKEKKKENTADSVPTESRRQTVHKQGTRSYTFVEHNARRRVNSVSGISREFRIVRDNRVNQNTNTEKSASQQAPASANVHAVTNDSGKSLLRSLTDERHLVTGNSEGQKSSQTPNGFTHPSHVHVQDANSNGTHRKGLLEKVRAKVPSSVSHLQGGPKSNNSHPHSTTSASSNSVVGLYSSSSDPVHVPSNSGSSGTVGAIKREVGVVGVRRNSVENVAKHPSITSSSVSSSHGCASISVMKSDPPIQRTISGSVSSNIQVNRSFSNNQHGGKAHQVLVGNQKAPQPNKEWKPKSTKKPGFVSPGFIETAASPISTPKEQFTNPKTEADHLQEKFARVHMTDNERVIIPAHFRVPEDDRTQLIFGSFGVDFGPTKNYSPRFQGLGSAENLHGDPSVSARTPSASSEDVNQVDLDGQVQISGSDSPPSIVVSEHSSSDKKESLSPQNLENYVDIGMVRNASASYAQAEPQKQQEPSSEFPSFSAYDPQTAYDMPSFRPVMEESIRGQGLPSPVEALSSHVANSIPASTMAMVQQPVHQLYPQVHLSHFPNFMSYRHLVPPVYVPPMAVPGYSSNAAYPHPSSGNSYLVMPGGGGTHLAAGNLKYGATQYKPIQGGTPTGFGSYANQAGYAINAQGTVGGASGLEDSTRMKYKDGNLYVPNPQAETSEIWFQTPREIPVMQSGPYYNIAGEAQHAAAAYMPSHTGHTSFNAAPTAQATHLQFPGLYHHPSQQATMANPHHQHMATAMGSNIGVGVAAGAAPGAAQVGAYQQTQVGHLNWNPNF